MYIKSRQGSEVLRTNYTVTDDINGVPTIETDELQLKDFHDTPIKMLSPSLIDEFVLVIKDEAATSDSSLMKMIGVHRFIYDMNLSRVYDEYTQYFSIENILGLIFDGTEYTFEVKGDKTYYALMFENFGDKDKMSLIQQICSRWEVEYHISGTHVVFGDRRGSLSGNMFRYKMNILDSNINLDISKAATYIRGYFGKKAEEEGDEDTYVEKELLHPLAEQYGKRDADPYSNENITQESTMNEYLKRKIEETWILSIEVEVSDLKGNGQVNVGDTVWAIDERLNIEMQTRVIKLVRYFDINDRVYKTKVTLGNYNFIDSVSNVDVESADLKAEIDKTNKRIEDMNANWDSNFNKERDELIDKINDEMERQKEEVQADFDAWKLYEEQARQSIKDSVDNIIGDMESIDTTIEEWQHTASSRFNTIEDNLLGKLNFDDLQPLESRLEASEKGIEGVFTNLGQLSGARNILSSENVSYIESAKVFMAGDYITSGEYVFSVHNPLYHNTKIDFTVYSKVEGKIIYHIDTTLTDMSTPFRFSIEDSVKEPTFLFSISNFTMADFEKAKIQLERGTEMTEWSPALADVGNVAELSSRITFNEERLHTAFTKIEGINVKENLATNTIGRHLYDRNYKTYDLQLKETLNKAFMISFDLELESYVEGMTDFVPRFEFEDGSSKNEFIPIAQTSEKQKVVHVYSGGAIKNIKLGTYNANHHSSGYISNVMVEYLDDDQTEPSPYSVSPIEVPNSISQLRSEFELTAENMDVVFNRMGQNEADIANFQMTADGLSSSVGTLRSDLDDMEQWSLAAGSDWQQTKDGFDRYVVANNETVDGLRTDVSNVVERADGISSTVSSMRGDVDDLEAWRADAGSKWEQTSQAITGRVWLGDAGGNNLIPQSDIPKERNAWNARGTNVSILTSNTTGLTEYMWVNAHLPTANQYMAALSPLLIEEVVEGQTYSIQFRTAHRVNVQDEFNYMYLMNEATGTVNMGLGAFTQTITEVGKNGFNGQPVFLHVIEFQSNFSGKARILFGTRVKQGGTNARFYMSKPKIEKGKATAYSQSPADFLQQTDFTLRSDGFFLGGKYVGGEHYSTAIVGDATGLKLIGDKISIDGNLDVLGKIRSEAINSVYANISEVRTRILIANSIKVNMLDVTTTMAEKFYTHAAFINNASIKAANIRDLETISLTSEQVRVGFNKIGSNIQITNSGLETRSGGTITSRVYSSGHEFFRAGNRVGKIGTASWYQHPTHRGLSFQLDPGASYFSFGLEEDIEDVYSAKLMWHKNGNATTKGFTMNDDLRVSGDAYFTNDVVVQRTLRANYQISAGTKATLQSSANGFRLYADSDVYLYLTDTGHLAVNHKGTAKFVQFT